MGLPQTDLTREEGCHCIRWGLGVGAKSPWKDDLEH